MIRLVLFPVLVDTRKLDKPRQYHKTHVGLRLLHSDLGPGCKLFVSNALKSELVTVNDGVKKREKIPMGEGGMGTLGPAVLVKGGTLMDSSVDNHCTFALHVYKLKIKNTYYY